MAARERINFVDYARGLAALAVAWFHLTNQYELESWVRISGSLGWLGVTVFFVLSGFVIPYSLATQKQEYRLAQYPRFILRRLVRLEPPYLLSVAMVIALAYLSTLAPIYAGGEPDYGVGQVAAHLLYIVPLTDHTWIQPVYWTLAYEFVFYLSIGLLFPLTCRARSQVPFVLASLVLLALVAPGLIPAQWALFIFGVAAFRREVYQENLILVLAVVAATAGAIWLADYGLGAVAGGLTALGLIFRRVFPRLPGLALAPLGLLGAVSYSLYLVHVPIGGRVVNLGQRLVEGPAMELALSLFALLVSLAAATIFYLAVERPATRLSRKVDGTLPPIWRFRSGAEARD